MEEQDRELQTYLKQSTIYFNEAGDHMYLKRASDGAVSHWKLADAEMVNRLRSLKSRHLSSRPFWDS